MKDEIFTFSHPVKVLQVFKLACVYDKESFSFELRKDFFEWKDFVAGSGYVKEKQLFLVADQLPHNAASQEGLIILEYTAILDLLTTTKRSTNLSEEDKTPSRCLWSPLNRATGFEVFTITYVDGLELYLRYNYFKLGEPERDNFLITPLHKNEPVEIKLNGKTDASMSSRRARVFKDQYFLIEYVGEFKEATILKSNLNISIQPPSKFKSINLLKTLW
jgi:hypothetical protein